jgi:hypothetical protein
MNCEETTALVVDRLKGVSSAADEQRLDEHLTTCAACRSVADSTLGVWQRLGELDTHEPIPHDRLRARFHAGLAAHDALARRSFVERWLDAWWPREPALQAGLATALLVVGLLVGRELPSPVDSEVLALRDEVRVIGLALLDHQSASERLLGIEWSRRTAESPDVVRALLERVQYDSNLSVRLAAIDALRSHVAEPEVGAGLAAALEMQAAPLLQVALADALLEGGSASDVAAVRQVLSRSELDPAVREYVQMALMELGDETTPAPGADI